MAGKKRLVLVLIAIGVVLLCAGALAVYLKNQSDNMVGKFGVSDYASYTQKYSVMNADYVSTADSARLIAEAMWNSVYGKDAGIRKPFTVSYDSANKIWLVKGSRPGGQAGVVPNILIQQRDGKILAIWFDK